MIRQIVSLTRPLEDHRECLALAVYAEPDATSRLVPVSASSCGFEGVACVDDAARAALLFLRLWSDTGSTASRDLAFGYLEFVLAQQNQDGAFSNFILDWSGQPNESSLSSYPGGVWWTARALHALAAGWAATDNARYLAAFERGLNQLDQPIQDRRAASIALRATLAFMQARPTVRIERICTDLATSIAACHEDGVLRDDDDGRMLSIWSHLQEAALARAGVLLDRPDWLDCALRSAKELLRSRVASLPSLPDAIPYDASTLVLSCRSLFSTTEDDTWARLGTEAAAWFDGNNSARRPVYDREVGCVYDGISGGAVSVNSGAEANIEGAYALWTGAPLPIDERGRRCL